MFKWITNSVPTELKLHKYLTDTITSKQVVVLVSSKIDGNYPCIATYTKNVDSSIDEEQGHWRLVGHNGNWDKRVLGWFPLPDII